MQPNYHNNCSHGQSEDEIQHLLQWLHHHVTTALKSTQTQVNDNTSSVSYSTSALGRSREAEGCFGCNRVADLMFEPLLQKEHSELLQVIPFWNCWNVL